MELFDIHLFEEQYKDGKCCIKVGDNTISMFEWDDCYSIQIEQATPSMVCILKRFFADTLGLKEEGCYLKWGHTKIGIWKKYDCVGNIIEETNYEEGWNISWEKLIPFLLEQGIKLGGIVGIHRYEKLEYEDEEEKPGRYNGRIWVIWQITQTDEEFEYIFDGDTGKLKEKTKRLVVVQ
jgi:hypothetical protein